MPERAIEVIDTDVLVLGGGFAGAWAALRAADFTDKVVLVDKAYVSRSGASAISGGVTTCPLDGDDLKSWAEEFIVRGSHMCDQDWTWQLLEGQRERVRNYVDWGIPISRAPDGSIRRFASRGMINVRGMQYRPKAAIKELRNRISSRGVHIADRVCIVELLTADGGWPTDVGIVGAVGFHVHTGQLFVFRAKRTILATGMISMKGTHGVDNDTGDGVAMAYRAGARLIDMEFTFGGTFSVLMKNMHFPSYNVAVAQGARLINARGERFMAQYDPQRLERSELSCVVAAFAKEVLDGRGPIYVDLRHVNETYWADILSLNRGNNVLLSDRIPNPRTTPLLIEPIWGLWAAGRAGLQIDLGCRTSLPGLLAAGCAAKNDATGTHASAGAPTAFCNVSGWIAGETAGRESRACDKPEIDPTLFKELVAKTFAPLQRQPNGNSADLLHDRLTAMEASLINGLVLSDARLRGMIETANDVMETMERTPAENLHDLVKLHEVRSVAECARLVYLTALDRTESREQFYREDYPEVDDDNWFCWHGTRRTASGIAFERIPIPDRPGWLKRPGRLSGLGPVAAIMTGRADQLQFH
jgi:succinate dehydrogenase/fumarate reductase flavoprotein subunit